jgi:4a-hydroxytetrahydrobiopterin dehydratase
MDSVASELVRKKCVPCEGGVAPLSVEQLRPLLMGLPGWELEGGAITRTYRFKDYFDTMAFVNAAAWVSHREDHHPDMLVGYGSCKVSYLTHAINGLTENDFICAAKLDLLFEP